MFHCDYGIAILPRTQKCSTHQIKCKISIGNCVTFHGKTATLKCPTRKMVKCHAVFQDSPYVIHEIKSQCFHDVDIGTSNINLDRSIAMKLLLSEFNTSDGIILSADMPFGQTRLMNISIPAVLRTYYGLDVKCIAPTKLERVTYGPTSLTGCLSMDPRAFSTKPMSTSMYKLGVCLKNFAKQQFDMINLDSGF